MENILEISGLNKSYGNFSLQDISFSLPEGCITGFIGINGAGKTTTLRTILGLTSKLSGDIRLFGMDMKTNEKQIKERIGIVLDGGGFYDDLSLAEMKGIVASAYKSWDELTYRIYLDRFSLNPKQKINELSKGMRMKYALALALSHKAELLIMDEPTSGLDPLIRSQLLDILKEFMANGGRGVFFSTHITSDLDKIADMLILIDNGKIIFQEEKDILLDSYRIVKGDLKDLTKDRENLFRNLSKTAFGFTGITNQLEAVKKAIPDAIIERTKIEDVMLCNIKGGKNDVVSISEKRLSAG
jgi:ABC-2 type transport system ATP-binding protein